MRKYRFINLLALFIMLATPFVFADTAFAQEATSGSIGQVENFIRSLIKVAAGLSGLVATVFFIIGGFTYITSSGNPEKLEKAKHTLIWSGVGLTIVIAAFVISTIVTDLATGAFGS